MSFIARVFHNLEENAAKTALCEMSATGPLSTSGAGLLDLIGSARTFLRARGIGPTDRVALLGPNSTSWVALDLAIMAEAAVCVPLYARQQGQELAIMLADCAPALLIVADQELEKTVRSAWPEACAIARYPEVFASKPVSEPPGPASADACVTIVYTSGTSGQFKGAMLTRANVDFMLERTVSALDRLTGPRDAQDRAFHYLPFCFGGSRIMLWTQLMRANCLTLSTDLDRLVQELRSADPHYYLNVPALLERVRAKVEEQLQERGRVVRSLYQRGELAYARVRAGQAAGSDRVLLKLANRVIFTEIRRTIGPSLRFLICGSAPLREETQAWFRMLGLPVYQVYGLTETTAIVAMDETDRVKSGYVGYPIEGCEIKISEQRELVCRGPNVFAGYWNRPEETKGILRDGWLHTGDQVEQDATGNLRVIGRIKDIVVAESGHNVAPAPIEAKLAGAIRGAEQVLVVGHGRPFLTAIVTGSAQDEAIDSALQQVNSTLPHYQRIRKIFRAPEPFSIDNGLLTANQKIKRAAIERRYQEQIEGMYR